MGQVLQMTPGTERLLTKRQLAESIGRSIRWIELRTHDGLPVHYIEGGGSRSYPRYRLSEVTEWLMKPQEQKREETTVRELAERLQAVEAMLEDLRNQVKEAA